MGSNIELRLDAAPDACAVLRHILQHSPPSFATTYECLDRYIGEEGESTRSSAYRGNDVAYRPSWLHYQGRMAGVDFSHVAGDKTPPIDGKVAATRLAYACVSPGRLEPTRGLALEANFRWRVTDDPDGRPHRLWLLARTTLAEAEAADGGPPAQPGRLEFRKYYEGTEAEPPDVAIGSLMDGLGTGVNSKWYARDLGPLVRQCIGDLQTPAVLDVAEVRRLAAFAMGIVVYS